MAWLAGYNYRKRVQVGPTVGSVAGSQFKVAVHSGSGADAPGVFYLGGNALNFPNDIRFTRGDSGQEDVEIDHCIDPVDPSSGTQRNFIVKHPLDTSSTQNTYIYYGNSGAESASSVTDSLEFGDDFGSSESTENSLGAFISGSIVQLENGDLLYASRNSDDVDVRRSTDSGESWSALSTPFSSTGTASEVDIMVLADGTVIVSSWHATDVKLYLKKSADSGATWGSEITISSTDSSSVPSIIELDSGNLLCTYTEGRPDLSQWNSSKVRISGDGGDTWGAATTIFSGTAANDQYEDTHVVELSDGKLIMSAENEVAEQGYSRLVATISIDEFANWGDNDPNYDDTDTISIKDEGSNVDDEGGVLLYIADDDIRYYFSTDEDDPVNYQSYDWANIKVLQSTDEGLTWGSKRTVHESMVTGSGAVSVGAIQLANSDIMVWSTTWPQTAAYWVGDNGQNYNRWVTVTHSAGNLSTNGGVVELEHAGSGNSVYLNSQGTFDDPVTVEYRSRVSSVAGYKLVGFYDLAGVNILHTQLNHLGNGTVWAAYNGTYETIAIGEDVTNFHIYRIDWKNSSSADVYIDGVSDGTLNTRVPNVSLPAFMGNTDASVTNQTFVSGFMIMKYPQPTVGTPESEEIEPSSDGFLIWGFA